MAKGTLRQNKRRVQRYDARGLRCPQPVIRMEAILRGLDPGDAVEIITDDPIAVIDIPHFCQMGGHRAVRDGAAEQHLKAESAARPLAPEAKVCVFRVTAGGKSR
ncbi:MAG: sulfurtransferase TusA family protein [Pseudomonadota bacterium]